MSSEAIITMVGQQPAIWDKFCEDYKDRTEKDKAWLAVAVGVYEEWDSFTKKEQAKKIASLKMRWKSLKDAMIKSLQTKSGDPATKKKKYVHFEAMSFLLPAAEKRRTSGNYKEELACDDEDDDFPPLNEDACRATSPTKPSSYQRKFFKQNTQPPKISPFQASLINSLDNATKSLQTPTTQPEDADRLYLLSLLPDYKNLHPSKKWQFRRHVTDFFQNVYLQSSPTPLSSHQPYSEDWSAAQGHYHTSGVYPPPTCSMVSPSTPSPNSS